MRGELVPADEVESFWRGKLKAFRIDEGNDCHQPPEARRGPVTAPSRAPVSYQRKSNGTGVSSEENAAWLPYLADGVGSSCAGRDPMTIPVEILSASGHPPRRTHQLVAAFDRDTGGENAGLELVKGYRDIRDWCLACTDGNDAETRRCTTIHCPFWPYRMGTNPHNQRRGVNPFSNVISFPAKPSPPRLRCRVLTKPEP